MNLDLGLAASDALSQQPVGAQNAGTYFNWGSGSIAAPIDNNLSPQGSATASAAAKSPGAGGASSGGFTGAANGGNNNTLLWIAVGLGAVSFLMAVSSHFRISAK